MSRLLDKEHVDFLATRPTTAWITLGGVRFQLCHATPSDPLYTYLPPSARDAWEEEMRAVEADVLLVGHTHLPMVLRFGDKTVVNPGSVGLPRERDPRASFAIIEDGVPRLEKVEYDVEATVAALAGVGLSAPVVSALTTILRTGALPR
jgi:protein phosphatase